MKRLLFDSEEATFGELQLQLAAQCNISVNDQELSTMRPPKKVSGSSSTPLTSLGLGHGDLLQLKSTPSIVESKEASSAPSSSSSTKRPGSAVAHKLTKRCNHGPRSFCLHCAPKNEEDGQAAKPICTHGPNATCPNCSSYIADDNTKEDVAEWLCNHPDTAFCHKCLPPEDESEEKGLKCDCNKAKGQQCIHCLDKGLQNTAKYIPYGYYMSEKRAMCKFSHGDAETCAGCAPPVLPSYVGKKNCPRGHRSWPHGVCLNCAPSNVHIRNQKYRHCDSVSIQDVRTVQNFYREWVGNGAFGQSAIVLFGRHIEEPIVNGSMGAVRSEVYAAYKPPQQNTKHGIRFLKDPNETQVHKVASILGLMPVGWAVTTLPREGEKYHGKVFMSGMEIRQAASFQNRYKDDLGHSRFVTIVVEHGENVEPQAYQVSDQCVAMERDGVFGDSADPFLVATRKPKGGELMPTVLMDTKPLDPGSEFLPDHLLLSVVVSTSAKPRQVFKHTEYPSQGSPEMLRGYFKKHEKEEYHHKLFDFNLLCNLPSVIGFPLTSRVLEALKTGKRFPSSLSTELDNTLKAKGVL